MRRIVITGLGAVTPLGCGVKRTWEKLLQGRSGIVSLKNKPGFESLPSQVAGLVPRGTNEGEWNPLTCIDQSKLRETATFTQFALAASAEALADAKWVNVTDEEREATGVCYATGLGNLEDAIQQNDIFVRNGIRKISPRIITKVLMNMPAGYISQQYGFIACNHTVTTACAAGCHAIGDAYNLIKLGQADVILAGGSEACINPFVLAGFSKARSLSTNFNEDPSKASRPFDSERDGFVIGEGAGALVLEELEHAKHRNAPIYAEILGFGQSADNYNITAPNPNGSSAYLAMKKALRNANVSPQDLDYINAHATSTKLGDVSESRAIATLLKGTGKDPQSLPVSSSKGSIGHLLGAAGAVESIFTILAIHEKIIPPTLNLQKTDIPEEDRCDYVPNETKVKTVNYALSNSFGFGGTNASLCIGSYR
ncbi:3-oxoacyl-[acyl-carrier-protein]-synthase [Schizosaccharomyces cryophilus OY26]|uniref:3-oxoacyl-[acyl-carrier-protein] synthase n=1 Tax=Schizosaccharomyces cryophilus (strain OY26 / ATCC MYA-4695 / CBS 11777 / NBRC 106824 / NRRL Y48691) TaxID=653667 RepID=S9VW84_SCHCR|nr:3-oxoacyl-[acyl-carrier-protein]-synthase [Schizosaccharomyces cryophilus OY26]EPY50499.1 3-oxoacyl-[acyl-carrier-protein]-synthase [Schizosaccharomyces cryophilus OY26]